MRVITDNQSNRYCVPAALSALLNRPVEDVCHLISEYFGDQAITGVLSGVAVTILTKQGYKVTQPLGLRPSRLLTLAKLVTMLPSSKTALVCTLEHMLVIHNKTVIDNSFPQGISIEKYPIANHRVTEVWEVASPQGVTK